MQSLAANALPAGSPRKARRTWSAGPVLGIKLAGVAPACTRLPLRHHRYPLACAPPLSTASSARRQRMHAHSRVPYALWYVH